LVSIVKQGDDYALKRAKEKIPLFRSEKEGDGKARHLLMPGNRRENDNALRKKKKPNVEKEREPPASASNGKNAYREWLVNISM